MGSVYNLVCELTLEEATEPVKERIYPSFMLENTRITEREARQGDGAATSMLVRTTVAVVGRQEGGRLLFVPGEGLPCAGLEPDPMLKLSARTA